jgi:hypothetical protein
MFEMIDCLDEIYNKFNMVHDNVKPKNFIFVNDKLKTEDFNLTDGEI